MKSNTELKRMLSIIIPAYNEEDYITQILQRVVEVDLGYPLDREIVVINDCSTDDTFERVEQFKYDNPGVNIRTICHLVNQGKGAAIRTGLSSVTGDFVIIQDADLEYDPSEYKVLLAPLYNGHADVVYGSRFRGGNPHRILFFWHSIGNQLLTFLSNVLTNLNLTDMETCYKMMRSEIIGKLDLKENRFGFEPELTAKISRIPGIRIYEVGISYYGRTYAEGKKIGWKDGFRAIWCILKYNIWK